MILIVSESTLPIGPHIVVFNVIAVPETVRAIFLTHILIFGIELILFFSLTLFLSAVFIFVRFRLIIVPPFLRLLQEESSNYVPEFGECSVRLQVQVYCVTFLQSVFNVIPFEPVPVLLYLACALIVFFLIRRLKLVDLESIFASLFITKVLVVFCTLLIFV